MVVIPLIITEHLGLLLSIQEAIQVATQINAHLHSHFPLTIKIWNSLLEAIIQASNVKELKR